MLTRQEYLDLLRQTIDPELRAEGFAGTLPTLWRQRGAVIQLFNAQGSKNGQRCYVNLGVHLDFLPTCSGRSVEAKVMKEYDCEFRCRLIPSPKWGSGWPYSRESARELLLRYRSQGAKYFARYAEFPEAFACVTPEEIARGDFSRIPGPALTSGPLAALAYARISRHLGDLQKVSAFAEVGLKLLGDKRVSLRTELERLRDAP